MAVFEEQSTHLDVLLQKKNEDNQRHSIPGSSTSDCQGGQEVASSHEQRFVYLSSAENTGHPWQMAKSVLFVNSGRPLCLPEHPSRCAGVVRVVDPRGMQVRAKTQHTLDFLVSLSPFRGRAYAVRRILQAIRILFTVQPVWLIQFLSRTAPPHNRRSGASFLVGAFPASHYLCPSVLKQADLGPRSLCVFDFAFDLFLRPAANSRNCWVSAGV
ncbi:UNVERIFIED_CONTAM: hypothetical protein HHA_452300 [Hammondia hammondi]|eukprot:XP_008885414.1 hypothetical protein HHA_452300 [Hammondia hammondi]